VTAVIECQFHHIGNARYAETSSRMLNARDTFMNGDGLIFRLRLNILCDLFEIPIQRY
jgi:hypothetical protein